MDILTSWGVTDHGENADDTRETATIAGGRTTRADTQELAHLAAMTGLRGRCLRRRSLQWEDLRLSISSHETAIRLCPVPSMDPRLRTGVHHPAFLVRCERAGRDCDSLARSCSTLSRLYSDLSDALSRADGLYSRTEASVSALFSGAIQKGQGSRWVSIGLPSLILGAGVLSGFGATAPLGGAVLDATDSAQEGTLNALARRINALPSLSGPDQDTQETEEPSGGSHDDSPVATAAGRLAKVARLLSLIVKGDKLTVTAQHPSRPVIGASKDISGALRNLDTLASSSAVPYSTVAVQKYVDSSGRTRWLVLIPGTQTHADAAIGWSQNIELMSSNNAQRMSAESTRLVLDAMRRSGIRKDEPVTLVGHSQGGIVAATIASGNTGYTIDHIVTAGSPIANHPVPPTTWVTSVENRGEIVSRLDGNHNPRRGNWVTVNGSRSFASPRLPGDPNPTGRGRGAKVTGHIRRGQLTHGLNYQRATWEDARGLGSPAVLEADRHFSQSVRGRLVSTDYYTGRISHTRDFGRRLHSEIIGQPAGGPSDSGPVSRMTPAPLPRGGDGRSR